MPILQRLALFVALLLPAAASATVILPVDLETIAVRADVIVRGTAQATTSTRTSDGKQIHSVTRVRIVSALKGEAPETIEVHTAGGTLGDLTQKVHGMAEFAPGEEVVLFLKRLPGSGAQHFAVESLSLGKFVVRAGKVHQSAQGLEFLKPDGKVEAAPAFEPIAEQAFYGRVRRALEAKVVP